MSLREVFVFIFSVSLQWIWSFLMQSKPDHWRLCLRLYTPFCSRDLDLDPMTLIYELDLDILKMYLHTKMNFVGQVSHKMRARTGQRRGQKRPNALPQMHLRVVEIMLILHRDVRNWNTKYICCKSPASNGVRLRVGLFTGGNVTYLSNGLQDIFAQIFAGYPTHVIILNVQFYCYRWFLTKKFFWLQTEVDLVNTLNQNVIKPSPVVGDLNVLFAAELSMRQHVSHSTDVLFHLPSFRCQLGHDVTTRLLTRLSCCRD